MKNHTYIVTGGNTGIGKAIARGLAQMQLDVVIISRDLQKGSQAVDDIRNTTHHERVDLLVGDLSTIASTHQLADTLLDRFPQTGVLINNAGVWMISKKINQDQLEYSFMVNHLAPFILSYRLVPLLKSNAPARIVNVIAKQYVRGKIDLERTPFGHDFSRVGTYANTKLCNLITTIQLANRLSRSGVTVNAVHPGVSQTELGNPSGFLGTLFRLAKRSLPSPAEGARAPVWLATSPDVVGINGQYFEMLKATEVEENARDDLLGRNLWDLSVNLAGLDSGSPH